MRIVSVTPVHVTHDELDRRQRRYDRIAPAGLKLELINLPYSGLTALDGPADVRNSDNFLVEEIQKIDLSGADYFLPDCILDPGYRKNADGSVVGMLDLVMSHLVSQGHKVGAVTRNPHIGAELVRRVHEYGYGEHFIDLEVLDLSFAAITDESLWHEKLQTAVEVLARKGATVVINGCSAVNVDQSRLPIKVVDPAEMALEILINRS